MPETVETAETIVVTGIGINGIVVNIIFYLLNNFLMLLNAYTQVTKIIKRKLKKQCGFQ